MVYISDFASFQQQGKDIFLSNPTRARFATKYRHCDGVLTMMVTNDAQCVQFRVEKAEDMRLVEEFTRTMVRLMSRGPAAADEADTSSVAQKGVAGSEGETAAFHGKKGKKRR